MNGNALPPVDTTGIKPTVLPTLCLDPDLETPTESPSPASTMGDNSMVVEAEVNSRSSPPPVKKPVSQLSLPGQQPLTLAPPTGSATGNPRNKVALQKGFSLMDWIRLTKSGKDLSGVGGSRVNGKVREVTKAELAKHKKRKDAWIALNGMVYNVTAYMDYHPGGWDELMKGAGKDATALFNEIHRWVNYESMLSACLVGKLVDKVNLPPLPPTAVNTIQTPPPPPVLPPISKNVTPAVDYFQTDGSLTVILYTRRKGMAAENVIVDNFLHSLRIICYLPEETGFVFHYNLRYSVLPEMTVKVGGASGKVEVTIQKVVKEIWRGIGTPTECNNWFGPIKDQKMHYRKFRVKRSEKCTHDTRYLVIEPVNSVHLIVPPGHHVQFKSEIEGTEIQRSYTPVIPLNKRLSGNGSIKFLIKIYQDGAFSPLLGALQEGDDVMVSDHTGKFSLELLEGIDRLYLITAGTGVTPVLSILPFLKKKKTVFLNFNKTEQDILWRTDLDEFSDKNPWFTIVNILSDDPSYGGLQGRIRKEILDQFLDQKSHCKKFACICGPGPFVHEAERLLTEEFNFTRDDIHLFQG